MRALQSHLADYYGLGLTGEFDSLEAVMAFLYTDCTMNIAASERSLPLFRDLVGDLNSYLANTTNDLDSKSKGPVYRIVARLMNGGVVPRDISIVTFNQDLQAEKALYAMSRTSKWGSCGGVFVFPGMYGLPGSVDTVRWGQQETCPVAREPVNGIKVLKLHGSLNWHTRFDRPDPTLDELFDPSRGVEVTSGRTIRASLRLRNNRTGVITFAQPIVIPPVTHKGGLIPDFLENVWNSAEEALSESDIIIVFGYSCPVLDHESANLLRRCFVRGGWERLATVNPDAAAAARFGELMGAGRVLQYVKSVEDLFGAFVDR